MRPQLNGATLRRRRSKAFPSFWGRGRLLSNVSKYVSNPYSPPSVPADLELSSDRSLRRARATVWVIAVSALLFDVFIMSEMGRVQAVILGRMATTSFLLYYVYFRRKWARILLVALFVLTSLLNATELPRLGSSFWGIVTASWILFHLLAAVFLVASPAAGLFSAARESAQIDDETDLDDDERD
jgi:hypothetical protein